ncbi:hypothetical protein Tco_1482345 [Tanacetum coccineum]
MSAKGEKIVGNSPVFIGHSGGAEQMLLAMKDEAESNHKDEETDFMLDNSYGDETLKELTVAVIMMGRIQPADDNGWTCSNHMMQRFSVEGGDDPYVKNNGGTFEHDSNAHDVYHNIQMLAYNVQREVK